MDYILFNNKLFNFFLGRTNSFYWFLLIGLSGRSVEMGLIFNTLVQHIIKLS